ncbi:MAG: polyribonucleotide nucleotidyltransferase [Chloroflexi bacterium]|nr:polyribonucleotide nucleotidyltransferase [Chloroflexota bacterium]
MSQEINKFEIEVGGRILELETGRVAHQAHGAVTVRYGDTLLLCTATGSKKPREGVDFLPLTIDVSERAYAAGKLPGGFFKREGRPSTDAILAARLCDRPLRPLFPKDYHNETQIITTVMSADRVNPYAALGIIGASAALTISDIPFDDPVSACVIGLVDGELVVNPTYQELQESLLDLTVAGTADAIMMVEAGARMVSEDVLLDALELAQEVNGAIVELIREMQAKIGKTKWQVSPKTDAENAAAQAARSYIGNKLKDALKLAGGKQERSDAIDLVGEEAAAALIQEHDAAVIKSTFQSMEKEAVRESILNEGRRPDGRSLTQIRPLNSEVGYLPRVHGSAIFTRGETQIMNAVTLASAGERQRLDTYGPEEEKFFIHHYNFPPFSTGEVGRYGFTGRREIGHGVLAERALQAVIPTQVEFPYTIRSVSEALSSNGSTSMASICAGSLALMDAGVPIKAAVAGIAMGLITGEGGKYAILTDIQGAEDHSGDMDFKVAGTSEGVTALQMDIKVKGITFGIMREALAQARTARLEILEHMARTLAAPRADLSEFAPRMISMNIPTDKIGALIGPGGSIIRGLIEEYGVTIDVNDDGVVVIGSPDRENADKARTAIGMLTRNVEVGQIYKGKVVRIMPFGAFVQLIPGKDGLVHISELSENRVPDVESVVSIGDELEVMVIKVDHMGRVDLSARAVAEQSKAGEVRDDKEWSEKFERRDRRDGEGDGPRGGREGASGPADRQEGGAGSGGRRDDSRGGERRDDRRGGGSDRGPRERREDSGGEGGRRDDSQGGGRRSVGGFDGERRVGPPPPRR